MVYSLCMPKKVETRKYADRADYLKKAVADRRRKLKQKAVIYAGGKCSRCGYDRCFSALTFHHIDPSIKKFGISTKGLTRSWEKVKSEIDKCILVCANCHAEIHDKL